MKEIEKIKAPFTDDQVKNLNEYQTKGRFHPFTCCSPESISECTRAVKEVNGEYIKGTSEGLLVASNEGWVCPCGKYKQNWAHAFMAEKLEIR